MYTQLLCEIEPLPKNNHAKEWRDWCMKISDAMLDISVELQRPTLVSDALYAYTMAVVYEIPADKWGKPINEISTLDIFLKIMEIASTELWKNLGYFDGWDIEPQEKLAKKFKVELDKNKIDVVQWCIMLDVPIIFVKPWLESGVKLGCRKLIISWLNMNAPWPLQPWQRLQLESYK